MKNIKKLLNVFLAHNRHFFNESNYLLLVSHMRSRSSLLSHIIGSHQNICGYCEIHGKYTNRINFLKSKIKILSECGKPYHSDQILFDKVLHNHLKISPMAVEKRRSRIIFMVREPISTIKSIAYMYNKSPSSSDINNAAKYYTNRLEEIRKIYLQLPKELCYFVNSENLITNPEKELYNLSNWLKLNTPLSKDYDLFNNSGKPGFGDSSENILTGKIVQTIDKELPISEDIKHAVQRSYQQYNDLISQ